MKYILLILAIIFLIFIYYKIITPYPIPSKYYDPENSKYHIFMKEKAVIKFFTKYNFFIKSLHISGDEKEIKAVEIQSFLPFFFFKFFKINGFNLKKTDYGACYFKEKGDLKELDLKGESFGFFKTKPLINFKFKKNENFEFESIVKKEAKEDYFALKDGFDIEVYRASSPHFSLLFPEIEDIEIYYKKDSAYLRMMEGGRKKELKFGNFENFKYKKEKLSFYLKAKDMEYLKKFIKNPFLENLKEIEIKCYNKKNFEICNGRFLIKKGI